MKISVVILFEVEISTCIINKLYGEYNKFYKLYNVIFL